MTQPSGSPRNGTGCLIGIIVVLVGLAWLGAIFALPHYKMDYADAKSHGDAMAQVSFEVQYHLVDTTNMVLVPRLDGGLDIFVTQSSFESVPYPDRDEFVLAVTDIWCENVSSAFLPSVRFRDIRSGEVMGRKLCDFASSPDPAGNYSGTVHNKTADLRASFDLQMIAPNNTIKGCMQVGSPLIGTGPIIGTLNGGKFRFDLNEPGMHIRFEGTRSGHTVKGEYVVTSNLNGRQTGEFTLHQDSIRVTVPNGYDLDRCPRG